MICAFPFVSVSKQLICRDLTFAKSNLKIFNQISNQVFESNIYSSNPITKCDEIAI